MSFDDSPETATELAELVVDGRKRATAALLRQFSPEGEPLPIIGGYVVLVDGHGRPRAIWRTKELRLGPLVSVDEAFAWDEGEGDRTRASWPTRTARFSAGWPSAAGSPSTMTSKRCLSASKLFGR